MIPKFKIWVKKENKLRQVTELEFEYNKLTGIQSCYNWYLPEEIELLQWTGLCDRNGTEIYEGDILQYYDSEGDEYFKAPIRWADEYACFLPMGLHTGEVIGNIYENPELLEGE